MMPSHVRQVLTEFVDEEYLLPHEFNLYTLSLERAHAGLTEIYHIRSRMIPNKAFF